MNPAVKTMGPEQWTQFPRLQIWTAFFLNGSNHADGKPPQLLSVHHVSNHDMKWESWFPNVDAWMESIGRPLEAMRVILAPDTQVPRRPPL